MLKDDFAIALVMLIEDDAEVRAAQQPREQPLSFFDWLASQVSTVQLKQVEHAMHGTGECVVAADQLKDRKPVLVANDCLAVDLAAMPITRKRRLGPLPSMR